MLFLINIALLLTRCFSLILALFAFVLALTLLVNVFYLHKILIFIDIRECHYCFAFGAVWYGFFVFACFRLNQNGKEPAQSWLLYHPKMLFRQMEKVALLRTKLFSIMTKTTTSLTSAQNPDTLPRLTIYTFFLTKKIPI